MKLTPLGGVGQIGHNMTLVESDSEGVIIDAGLLFPRDRHVGVNYLIPNFYSINKSKFKKLFLTHAHEDHIGAIGQFVDFHPEIEIYCSNFCKEVVQEKFKRKINFNPLELKEYSFQGFSITPFGVEHSTPETHGFYISSNETGVVFATDFKTGSTFPVETIKNLSKNKTRLIAMLDSTNAHLDRKTPQESDLQPDLSTVIKKNKRTMITFFPSNIERMSFIISEAIKQKKTPVLYGRSAHFYYKCAKKAGLIEEDVVDIEDFVGDKSKMVALVSGCQADFRSTVKSIAKGASPFFKPGKDDLIVFSSSVIPGNEKQLQDTWNTFVEAGCELITFRDLSIHCSGHAGQHDLATVLQAVPFTDYIPIHGESFLIRYNCNFAKNRFPEIKVHEIHNYSEIIIGKEIQIIARTPRDPLLIASNEKQVSREVIAERFKMAESGAFFISVVDKPRKFNFETIGMEKSLIDPDKIAQIVQAQYFQKKKSRESLRIEIRKYLKEIFENKPIVIVSEN